MLGDKPAQELGADPGMIARHDQHGAGGADVRAGCAQGVARAKRLLLHRDGHAVELAGRLRRKHDDEGIRLEWTDRLDDPVDEPPPQQRVQMLRERGLHARAESGRHHDGCKVA